MSIDSLFSPLKLGRLQLPNRIIMAPLTRMRAGADNVPTALNVNYYAQRASAGLIISDVVTYHSLRSFLVSRVDQQLNSAAFPVGRDLLSTSGLAPKAPAR